MNIPTNAHQSPVSDELLSSMNDEVRENFLTSLTSVPLIANMISPNRRRAKDMPKDAEGKIIVDLENPHILENMDYFRQAAIHYQTHGCYTFLRKNSNPNSEYMKWLKEETRRCYFGLVREDGEWITGDYYFFLNYSPIQLTKKIDGTDAFARVEDFPMVWDGHYLRSHYLHKARSSGMHALELASRGKGKSYFGASMLSKRFHLGEIPGTRKVNCIVTAYDKNYLNGPNQILVMFQGYIDHVANHTEFPRSRLQSSITTMRWVSGYINADTQVRGGSENTVSGIVSRDSEAKLRGSRGVLYIIEESGTFPRLSKIFNVLRPSVEDGGRAFGMIYCYGTAGDKDSDFSSMQEMMYHPNGFNIMPVKNVYDKVNSGNSVFAFFFPAYLNMAGYYDEDGNSDVVGALVAIHQDRYKVKYGTSDTFAALKRTAEYPITPQEAILNTGNSLFPVAQLTERLGEIDANPSHYDDVYVGEIVQASDGSMTFRPSLDQSIRVFPHQDNKLKGAVEIYNMPEKNANGKVFPGRYILSCDPYENDQADTMSLGSVFVLDLWTDNIVAEYTGRPMFVDDFFEIVRRLCIFYNGKVNYENNKKGLFAYFQKMNGLHMLEDTLEFLKDKQMIKTSTFGNSSKGTPATAFINDYARGRIKDWLISPVEIGHDELGNPITTLRLNFLRGRALIQELISYNTVGNFDRVSSLGMLMLYREDKLIKHQIGPESQEVESDYLGNDNFFSSNYNASSHGRKKGTIGY